MRSPAQPAWMPAFARHDGEAPAMSGTGGNNACNVRYAFACSAVDLVLLAVGPQAALPGLGPVGGRAKASRGWPAGACPRAGLWPDPWAGHDGGDRPRRGQWRRT